MVGMFVDEVDKAVVKKVGKFVGKHGFCYLLGVL
jgi:hypothetical protein